MQRRTALTALASRALTQQVWCDWLRERLPADLAPHLLNVVPRAVGAGSGALELVALADSSAWSARLRYALAALQPQIQAHDAAVQGTRVRVSMRSNRQLF